MSESAARNTTAAMIVIGNEILSGKVVDSNSPFLARQLRSLGVSLERVLVIPDDVETIAAAVADFAARFDYVFTSGGVGPTHDDVTIEGVARAFGVGVVVHPELRRIVERAVGQDPPAAYLKMAEVPEGAELLDAGETNFPTVLFRNVYILPGIPEIFQAKVKALRERFRGRPYHLRQVFVAASETAIAEYLNATLGKFPDLLLGSYPKLSHPEYSVRLTLESKDEEYLDRALEDLISRMPDHMIVKVER
ncbi:MAG: competence/damage-inducible protein A [Candidatus Dadabacteria bacterium]|nr:MAG: competence/damage-inducible protein A [Candidatus Dadabacteria bacterium]